MWTHVLYVSSYMTYVYTSLKVSAIDIVIAHIMGASTIQRALNGVCLYVNNETVVCKGRHV